jgi:hypothetical protein
MLRGQLTKRALDTGIKDISTIGDQYLINFDLLNLKIAGCAAMDGLIIGSVISLLLER